MACIPAIAPAGAWNQYVQCRNGQSITHFPANNRRATACPPFCGVRVDIPHVFVAGSCRIAIGSLVKLGRSKP